MGTRHTEMNTTKAATGFGIDQTRHPLYHATPNTHTHTEIQQNTKTHSDREKLKEIERN